MDSIKLAHQIPNFLTDEEKEVVENSILSTEFPWYYQEESTVDLFPFFSHVIHPRVAQGKENEVPPAINSPLAHFVKPIIDRYCQTYLNRPVDKIYRSCLNTTYGWNFDYPFTEPHTDHVVDHYNMIVYLNDDFEGGETLLFDKYFCQGMTPCMFSVNDYDKVNVLEKLKPEKYKAVVYDGNIYHGMANIKSGKRRVILVTTFI
jgi:hypothetical protein